MASEEVPTLLQGDSEHHLPTLEAEVAGIYKGIEFTVILRLVWLCLMAVKGTVGLGVLQNAKAMSLPAS